MEKSEKIVCQEIEKENEPIRVLHVLGSVGLGGAESRIMDLFRVIDRNRVQFDFLIHMNAEQYRKALEAGDDPTKPPYREPEYYDEEILALGGRIYALPRFRIVNLPEYRKAIEDFFEKHHEYSVVQGHMTSTAALYLPIARKHGCGYTVAHARSAGVDQGAKGWATKLLRRDLWQKADQLFTCSDLARVAVFGDHPACFIPNAIRVELYRMDPQVRNEVRAGYGIREDEIVIGHAGRFHYAKNHEFLLKVFARVHRMNSRTVLLMMGDGPERKAIEELADRLEISDFCIFAGNRNEPWREYMGMDFFLFPSRYEGLPGTLVEAQASGLPCLISDRIADEAVFSPNVYVKNLEEDVKDWADCVLEHLDDARIEGCEAAASAGFDVRSQAGDMERFYMDPGKETLPGSGK